MDDYSDYSDPFAYDTSSYDPGYEAYSAWQFEDPWAWNWFTDPTFGWNAYDPNAADLYSWLSTDPLSLPALPSPVPESTAWNALYGTEGLGGGPSGPGPTPSLGQGLSPLGMTPNDVSGVTEPPMGGMETFTPTPATPPGPPGQPGTPSLADLQLKLLQKQIADSGSRGGMSAWAGPAVSGVTGLTGALLSYFGRPKPRQPTADEQAELAARTDLLKAQAEAARAAAENAGAKSGGPKGPLPPGGPPNIQAFLASLGAKGGAGRPGGVGDLSTLLGGQATLGGGPPAGGDAAFQRRVSQLEQAEAAQIHARYQKQRQQAIEMANRLGQNPTGLLQALAEQEMRELQTNRANAEQQALAIEQAHAQVGQTQASTRATQLQPNLAFLQMLAQLFAQPAPGVFSNPEGRF
jgi:hypothetical protein